MKKVHITKKSIKKELYDLKPEITLKDNLRYIEPYTFKYQLYAKGRWVNKRLLDILMTEFSQYSEDYFLKAISDEKILINSSKTSPDYKIQSSDFITHSVIRNENPILDAKVDIIHEDDDFLVVDKPSSWPVHVCGGYQFNTLHRILLDEYNQKEIKVLHRLDKHTSGIVICAKNSIAARKFREKIEDREVCKIYLARVRGDFPKEGALVKRHIIREDKAKGIYTDCDVDDKVLSKDVFSKDGVRDEDDPKFNDPEENLPKYAETSFERLYYNEESNTSVVIAKPKTGRTHQIRIHLRFLGFPIANDPCYGGIVFNDLKEYDNPDLKTLKENFEGNGSVPVSQVYAYKIWLHAWKYQFADYKFETKMPKWALEEYNLDHKFK